MDRSKNYKNLIYLPIFKHSINHLRNLSTVKRIYQKLNICNDDLMITSEEVVFEMINWGPLRAPNS